MSETSVLHLSRSDSTPWGFRIQGGMEFGTPLYVLKVNPNSLAQKAGLQPGDAILQIGGRKTESMRHKEAQDTIIGSGNNIQLIVGRDKQGPMANGSVVTRTSFTSEQRTQTRSTQNVSAKPFDSGTVTAVMHKQFNSPAAMYSMQNIAETLSAHTEVLATGVKGINFMKEEAPINTQSAVYRLVHEEATHSGKASPTSPLTAPPLVRHIEAQSPKPAKPESKPAEPGSQNICGECGAFIMGVFARIGDKTLHPECFKCNTCGVSLKNVGHFNINNKLYCDIHAKAASKMSSVEAIKEAVGKPVAPLSPVLLPQYSPSGLPSVHSVSPIPFHRMPSEVHHVEPPMSQHPGQSPLSFSSAPAPPPEIGSGPSYPSSISRPAPTKPTASMGFSKAFTQINRAHSPATGGSKFMWPPQKQEAPSGKPIFEPITSQAPPQGIQQIGSSQSSSFTSKSMSSVESSRTTSMFQSSSHQQISSLSSVSSAAPPPSSEPFGSEPSSFPTPIQPPVAEPTFTLPTAAPAPVSVAPPKDASTKPVHSTPGSGQRPQAPGIGSRPAPRRGRGQLITTAGTRIPICAACASPIRGPFITALSKSWCPDHFLCTNSVCRQPLQDIGFVEDQGQLYCENCYEAYLAPVCAKCNKRIKEECLIALDKHWHTDCFICAYCSKPFGNDSFFLEDGLPYCEKDWNELFTTKCVGCGFPIEAGDRWVEALNNNYHSQCFKCTICHKNLEGQSFYAKAGRPICKAHAR